MGAKGSRLFGRKGRGQATDTSGLPYPQLPAHASSHRAFITLAASSLAVVAAPSVQITHWPAQHLPVEALHSSLPVKGETPVKVGAPQALLYIQPPPAPTSVDTAVSAVRQLLETVKEASDSFAPLKTALGLFLKVWDVYDRTVEVRDDFVELASKLTALNAVVTNYNNPGDTNLQERLEAIAIAINQLAEAVMAKQDRGVLGRASQSMGDVTVVKIMFRRVTSLLEVFQFEAQIRAETLLVTILERLDTAEQHKVTSVDAVQVIIAHMDQQHSSTLERYQAILDQLERGEPAGDSETVINNNSNQNELDGPADLENNNANETELEVEGRGGGIVNNNSNVNRVVGSGASSPAGEPGGEGSPWPRTRITNNNGNKNVIRRTAGAQKATPSRAVVL